MELRAEPPRSTRVKRRSCQTSVTAFFWAPSTKPQGFVRFHDLTAAAHWRHHQAINAHGFTQTMRHEPSGFESAAKGAVKLVRANALFAG